MLNLLIATATHVATEAASAPSTLDHIVNHTIDGCIVLTVIGMFLCVLRLLKSSHLADRALAADTLGIELIGLVVLMGMRFATSAFIDGILVLSLLSFAGTVAIAQYIARPHMRHQQTQNDEKSEDLA
ncbi:MAG: hypothetical protein JKX85_12140 [Phycisphaeraceae bacterium]|nr:hypothetical protein [Phycisphaeraceae bacterium]